MTKVKRQAFEILLKGGSIANMHRSGYRLRNERNAPVRKLYRNSFESMLPLLKKQESLYLIDLQKVCKLHGNNLIKRMYLQLQGDQATVS